MRCLVTGCELHDLGSDRWAHGDLHEVGGAYVFNATLDERGETNWHNEPRPNPRVLLVSGNHFERRGVIVVAKTAATMTDAAKRHAFGDGTVRL